MIRVCWVLLLVVFSTLLPLHAVAQHADPERYEPEAFLQGLPYRVLFWDELGRYPYQHAELKPVMVEWASTSTATNETSLLLQSRLAGSEHGGIFPHLFACDTYFYYVPHGSGWTGNIYDATGHNIDFRSTSAPIAPDTATAAEVARRIWRYAGLRTEYTYQIQSWHPVSPGDRELVWISGAMYLGGILALILGNDDTQKGGAAVTVLGGMGLALYMQIRRADRNHRQRLLELEAELDALHGR